MVSRIIAPFVAGVLLAGVSLFQLVSAQTAAPATNPASSQVLTYGDR